MRGMSNLMPLMPLMPSAFVDRLCAQLPTSPHGVESLPNLLRPRRLGVHTDCTRMM